ncbi:MAG TPA: alcohol dehydrogenase catalytic domain-containing protein [Pseudonocardiaceae bacterium]
MRAVCYDVPRGVPEVREVGVPECPPDGVLVRVHATGLCRSDWHGWMGHDPDIRFPHVPGHEFAGTVHTVGADVTGWTAGDRVTTPFVNACGSCGPCAAGQHQVCAAQTQPGFSHWGSFAEYVVVRHAAVNLVRLPDGLDHVTAAGLGCRFATSYRAIAQVGEVRDGEWVVVHGCGGVGLAAVMVAAARGARVIAVDVSATALDLAASIGASHTLDAGAGPVAAQVLALTGGGADVTVDAIGRASVIADSLASLRIQGRHLQVGLLVGPDARPPTDLGDVMYRELRVLGSHGMAAHRYPAMLDDIAAGRLDPARLVTRTISLDEAPAALASFASAPPTGTTVIVL